MAEEFNYLDLAIAAQAKLARLTGSPGDMEIVQKLTTRSLNEKRNAGDRMSRMMDI